MAEFYFNETNAARDAISEMVRLVKRGEVKPLIGVDTETAPIPGLEGYPGTLFELVDVKDAEGNVVGAEEKVVRARKDTYLRFVQRVWRGSFSPSMLQLLKLYIPKKTISGKEDGVDAKVAWDIFLRRVYELEASEPETGLLELARWTPEGLDGWLAGLKEQIGPLTEEKEQLEGDIHSLNVMGITKGLRTKQSALKKLNIRLEEMVAEYEFLDTYTRARLTEPVDLRLLLHVAKVAVEGRIYLDRSGSNRMDPVRPGLDPFTSTIFLVQFTLKRKGTGELLNYIFNTHKVDIRVLLPVLKLAAKHLGANIKFDLKMLLHHAGYAPKDVFCTRVASRMLNLGRKRMSHALAPTYQRYCGGDDISKEVRSTFIGRRYLEPSPEQIAYAYKDTAILPELYEAQLRVAAERGQTQLIDTFSRLSFTVARWEVRGYQIDTDRWMEIAAGVAVARDKVAHELEEMLLPSGYAELFGAPEPVEVRDLVNDALFDYDDEADLKNVVFGDEEDDTKAAVDVRANPVLRISQTELVKEYLGKLLDMNLPALFENGKVSLGKDGRAAIEREYRKRHNGEGHEFFVKYDRWSKLAKQASTYGKRFLWYIHPLTGRIHPTINIAGTDTGRFSGTNPNPFNIPAGGDDDPDFRGAFIVDETRRLWGADYESMELFICGNAARDPVIAKMKETGVDPHGFTAANMFHIRQNGVSEPTVVDDIYRRGSDEYPIKVWEVPSSWTPQQIIDFAASPEIIDHVLHGVKNKITRKDGKTVTFRWEFRGGPFGLAMKTGLPEEFCKALMARFVEVYQASDDYLNSVSACIDTNHLVMEDGVKCAYAEGYGGIRRYVELPKQPYYKDFQSSTAYSAAAWKYKKDRSREMRALANLPMQGGNAVITAEALLYIQERGEALGIQSWLPIYDEIIVEFDATTPVPAVQAVLIGSMLDAADTYMTFIPAGAEANPDKIGRRWVKS